MRFAVHLLTLGFVAACAAPAEQRPTPAPVAPVASVPAPAVDPPKKSHAVIERLRGGGGDVYVLHAGKDPSIATRRACLPAEVGARALAVMVASSLRCAAPVKVSIGYELEGNLFTTRTVTRVSGGACTAASKPNVREVDADEIVIDAVRVFASRTACERADQRLGARALEKGDGCFDEAVSATFDERITSVPDGAFVERFEALLAKPVSVWRSELDSNGHPNGSCSAYEVVRDAYDARDRERRRITFAFVRKEDVRGHRQMIEHGFAYDRICRTAEFLGIDGTTFDANGVEEGHSTGGDGNAQPLADRGPESLPLERPWFYTKAACITHTAPLPRP